MSTRSSKKVDPVAGALAAASAVTYIDNRNKQSFPALRTIIFVGLLGLVLCVSLLYLADPSLTTEYAGHAADMVNDFKDFLLSAEDTDDDGDGGQQNVMEKSVMDAIAAERVAELNYTGFDPATTKYTEGHVRLSDFDFIWRKPSAGAAPAGVVLALHTCGRAANSWFKKSRQCPDCIGLPIQTSITDSLAGAGYVVVAMSPVSTINTTQCWTMKDRKYLVSALKYVYNAMNQSPKSFPLYALASENGALFISTNSRVLRNRFGFDISAFCLMNVGVGAAVEVPGFSPVMFVDMEKNIDAVKRNAPVTASLNAVGIDAVHYISKPRPMNENFFMPTLPEPQSKTFFEALKKEGFVSAQNNTLMLHPLRFVHHKRILELGKKVVPRYIPSHDTLRGSASAIAQKLNVAWGYSEINDEFITQTIDFFKKHVKIQSPSAVGSPGTPAVGSSSSPPPSAVAATKPSPSKPGARQRFLR